MAGLIHAVLLTVAFLVIFDVKGVNCELSCYSCSSDKDDRCGEYWPWTNFFNPPKKVSCVGQCMKTVGGIGDSKLVTRSCNPVCFEAGLTLGVTAFTKCCSTDDCNSAGVVKINLVLLLFMVVAAAIWRNP